MSTSHPQASIDYSELVYKELLEETDRAAVVLSAAWADALLEDLLTSTQQPSGGRFSDRINRVHDRHLVNAEFHAAQHSLRKLRNDFAHNVAKPGNLLAVEHKQHLDSFLGVFRNSSLWAAYYTQLGRAPFPSEDIPLQFRHAVSYLLSRIRSLAIWARNGEILSDVGLFPSVLPPP